MATKQAHKETLPLGITRFDKARHNYDGYRVQRMFRGWTFRAYVSLRGKFDHKVITEAVELLGLINSRFVGKRVWNNKGEPIRETLKIFKAAGITVTPPRK